MHFSSMVVELNVVKFVSAYNTFRSTCDRIAGSWHFWRISLQTFLTGEIQLFSVLVGVKRCSSRVYTKFVIATKNNKFSVESVIKQALVSSSSLTVQ